MGTDAISPLRSCWKHAFGMTHDRGHERAPAPRCHAEEPYPCLQAVRDIPEAIARHRYRGRHPPVPAAPGRERAEHLSSQPHDDRAQVSVPGDLAALGPGGRDLSHQRATEDSVGYQRGRDQAPVGSGKDAQGSRAVRPRLRLWPARQRGGSNSRPAISTAPRASSVWSSPRGARTVMSCCRRRCSLSCGNGGRRVRGGTTSACRPRNAGCSLASGVANR